jgi:hypothetical protein
MRTNTLPDSSENSRHFSRRNFLTTTGAGLVGLLAGIRKDTYAMPLLAPPRPGGLSDIILGSGEHRYVANHDWLTMPDHILFGDTHGLAQDSRGRIYVGHTVHPNSPCKDAIVVFDSNGRYITSWGDRFAGGSHGLEIRREMDGEYIYHCDTRTRQVVKTNLDGKVIWERGAPDEVSAYRQGAPYVPTNVAFGPNGAVYVTDGYGSDFVHEYHASGSYVRTFGGKGKEPGKLSNAHGIWVDNRGNEPFIVVADRGNSRLQYFTLDGQHVKFVSDGMRQPCHMDIRGDVMLVPDLKSVVTLLDGQNKVITQLGDGDPTNLRGAARERFIPGKFIHPHDAIFLQNGDILVAEWVPVGRITLLDKLA